MKMRKAITKIGPVLAALACGLFAQSPAPVIIVNKSNPVASLTKAQMRKIITGAQAKWPSGEKVVLLLPAPGSPERKNALSLYCGMTEQQLNADIIHASFVGEERVRARSLPNGKAIASAIQLVPGAVGIVTEADITDQVKLVPVE
jgi:hypothetical protein